MKIRIQKEVSCLGCPWLCCYSLVRNEDGFVDKSYKPWKKCAELCENCRCSVHKALAKISPKCADYSCCWAGELIRDIFDLRADEVANASIQRHFSIVQYLAIYIYHSREKLKEKDGTRSHIELTRLVDFYTKELEKLSRETTGKEWQELEQKWRKEYQFWESLLVQ